MGLWYLANHGGNSGLTASLDYLHNAGFVVSVSWGHKLMSFVNDCLTTVIKQT